MARFSLKNPFQFFFPSDTNALSRKPSPPSRRFSLFRPSSQNSGTATAMPNSDINQDGLAAPPLSSPTESAIDSTFSSPEVGVGSPDSGLSISYFPDMSSSDKHLNPHPCPTCKRSPSVSSSVSSDASSTTSDIISRPNLLPRASTTTLTPLPAPAPVPGRVKHTVDPLSREFPKPAHEPTLEELLARKPGKWSLNHYVKNAREISLQPEQANAEARRREMEEAKRRLLDLAGR
ncbi:hypothetical protein QBC44DRAFT_63205 [Cladorrhinum sp. PSN332]|nr:hypothetical protein QBC44DRAFT_63205 [Cladorrhinum sp. PSN332]